MNDEEFYALSETPGEPPDSNAGLLADFDKATCLAEKLAEIQIPPRAPIVGNWLMEGDLGFVYGVRGLGKTWLAMLLARRIADLMKLVLKPGLGIGQQFFERRMRRVSKNRLRGHKLTN